MNKSTKASKSPRRQKSPPKPSRRSSYADLIRALDKLEKAIRENTKKRAKD